MLFNAENILLIGSVLLFVSIVVSKTGYRFGVPTLLVFLLVGMFFGSDGLGLQFHNAGEAQFIGMVALSILRRHGHQICRNSPGTATGNTALHCGGITDYTLYRSFYILDFGI